MRVLPMDVDEVIAQFAQLRERGRHPVDPRLGAPPRVDGPAQQHAAVAVVLHLVFDEPRRGRGGHRELGAQVGARTPLAHHARVAAFTEHQRERVDQDRLAGAGLAGEDREARLEVEFERVDDDEIANRKRVQHRRLRKGQPRRAGLPSSATGGSFQCNFWRSVAK